MEKVQVVSMVLDFLETLSKMLRKSDLNTQKSVQSEERYLPRCDSPGD